MVVNKKLLFHILPILLFSSLLSACTLPFIGRRKQAAFKITSSPKAAVFLDGEHIGSTPYFDEKLKPGDHMVKLVPESGENSLPWEARLKLSAGILTVVSRELGETIDSSSGYVLSLEKIPGKKNTSLTIVSTPDGAVVKVDSEPKGFAPIAVENISVGEHLLVISSPGYVEKNIKAKTIEGYKLTASVQLAQVPETEEKKEEEKKEEEATKSAELEEKIEKETKPTRRTATSSAETEDELPRPYVKIKDTPTGWLNVRSEPSTAKKEESILTKVDPGEAFPFIEANSAGWYKIEYKDGEEGWIAGQYAELYK